MHPPGPFLSLVSLMKKKKVILDSLKMRFLFQLKNRHNVLAVVHLALGSKGLHLFHMQRDEIKAGEKCPIKR